MGRAIRAALAEPAGAGAAFELRACIAPHPEPGDAKLWHTPDQMGPTLASLQPDLVVIDVSLAAGTEALVTTLENTPRALVSASTGLSASLEGRIAKLSERAPVLRARNLSPGIAMIRAMLRAIPAGERSLYDADIVERHHAAKKDAPSGTAMALGELLRGVGTERRPGGVAMHSLRGGTAPGTHAIVLSGVGETITLEHEVHDRAVFARGALRAARFLHLRMPGLYTFDDVWTEA